MNKRNNDSKLKLNLKLNIMINKEPNSSVLNQQINN